MKFDQRQRPLNNPLLRQVFERIARNSVLSALDGFNSTVFAYGASIPRQSGHSVIQSGVAPALLCGCLLQTCPILRFFIK